MDVYEATVKYLLSLPLIESWPELQSIVKRAAAMKPRDWKLPIIACQAVGAAPEQAIPASAAIACAQISIILIDDLLDEDPRGEYRRIGPAKTANFAAAFQAAALEAFLLSGAPSAIKLAALGSLNQMILNTAFGQNLDIQNPSDEAAYWHVVENKSAPFYGAALHIGALYGGASQDVADRLKRFGQLYGGMIQIHDDLNDIMAVPANPDWVQKRSPLPILFARLVNHPERARFIELSQEISSPDALSEAQDILIHCGAVSYCIDQLLRRHQAAQQLLDNTHIVDREVIESLSQTIIEPVWKLFRAIGKNPSQLVIAGDFGNRG